jgi:hypothetical protein
MGREMTFHEMPLRQSGKPQNIFMYGNVFSKDTIGFKLNFTNRRPSSADINTNYGVPSLISERRCSCVLPFGR